MNPAISTLHARGADRRSMFLWTVWRFFRHGAGMLAGATAIFCIAPVALFWLIGLVDPDIIREMRAAPSAFQMILRAGLWIALPCFLLSELAHIRPLFVLPLTNRQIVVWQLTCAVVAIIALHAVIVLFYRISMHATVPFWAPLSFMIPAVIASAGLAAVLADFRWWRPLIVAGVMLATAIVVVKRSYSPWNYAVADSPSHWLTPSWSEFVGIVSLAVVGFSFVVRSISKARCGELRAWPELDALLQRTAARLGSTWHDFVSTGRFRSGTSAQFWFEWWEKGLIVPLIAAFFCTVSLIGAYHDPAEWLAAAVSGVPMFLVVSLFGAGLLFGIIQLTGRGGNVMREYRATRPLTDTQMAYAIIKGALVSVLTTALVIGGFMLLVYLWSLLRVESSVQMRSPYVHVLQGLIVGWCLLGVALSLMMTGRTWMIGVPLALVFVSLSARPVLVLLSLRPAQIDGLYRSIGECLLGLVVLGTIAAYVLALRRQIMSVRTAIFGVLVWFAAFGLCYIAWPPSISRHTIPWVFLPVSALVSSPLATAPLALSWNRHR